MNREILQKAIDTYGDEMQIAVAIEEMSELTKALIKDKRHNYKILDDWQNTAEEIADVKIMAEQLEMIFDCKEEVDKQIEFKLNRLKKRLEK